MGKHTQYTCLLIKVLSYDSMIFLSVNSLRWIRIFRSTSRLYTGEGNFDNIFMYSPLVLIVHELVFPVPFSTF